jgi:hypothetical protein
MYNMDYFRESYSVFQYPLKEDDTPGFRSAQLGAIHSAASHFSNRSEPAIITSCSAVTKITSGAEIMKNASIAARRQFRTRKKVCARIASESIRRK